MKALNLMKIQLALIDFQDKLDDAIILSKSKEGFYKTLTSSQLENRVKEGKNVYTDLVKSEKKLFKTINKTFNNINL